MSEEEIVVFAFLLCVLLIIVLLTFILCFYYCKQEQNKNAMKKKATCPIQIQEKKYSRTQAILVCTSPINSPKTSSYCQSKVSRPTELPSIGGRSQLQSEKSLPVFPTQPSHSILSGRSVPSSRSVSLWPALEISGRSSIPSASSLPMTYQEYSCSPSAFNTSYTVISPIPPSIQFPHQQTSTMKSGNYSNKSQRSSSKHSYKYGRKYENNNSHSCHTGRSCSSCSCSTPSDLEERGSLRHKHRRSKHKRRSRSRSRDRSRSGSRRSKSGSSRSKSGGNRRMSRTMKEWRK